MGGYRADVYCFMILSFFMYFYAYFYSIFNVYIPVTVLVECVKSINDNTRLILWNERERENSVPVANCGNIQCSNHLTNISYCWYPTACYNANNNNNNKPLGVKKRMKKQNSQQEKKCQYSPQIVNIGSMSVIWWEQYRTLLITSASDSSRIFFCVFAMMACYRWILSFYVSSVVRWHDFSRENLNICPFAMASIDTISLK